MAVSHLVPVYGKETNAANAANARTSTTVLIMLYLAYVCRFSCSYTTVCVLDISAKGRF